MADRSLGCAALLTLLAAPVLAQGERPEALRVEVQRNLAYAQRGSNHQVLDLFRPLDDHQQTKAPLPFGIVIHGGGWYRGNRYYPDAMFFCRMLNEVGIAAASVAYRLAPESTYPAQIDDCRAALQFLRANANLLGLDPNRVVAIGSSAGAHLAALLGTMDDAADPAAEDAVRRQSSRPQCVVAYSGPMSLLPTPDASLRAERLVQSFLGLTDPDDPDALVRARQASPLFHLTTDDVAMLLVHGTADSLVPFSQSLRMVEALAKLQVPHALIPIQGGRHLDLVARTFPLIAEDLDMPDYWSKTQGFILEQLGLRAPAGGEAQSGSEQQGR